MDAMNAALDLLWPQRLQRFTGWLLIAPALILVGVLVLGLVEIADNSLHVLDRNTFLPSTDYSLANYQKILDTPNYWRIIWRSLLGAGLTVVFTVSVFASSFSEVAVNVSSVAFAPFSPSGTVT